MLNPCVPTELILLESPYNNSTFLEAYSAKDSSYVDAVHLNTCALSIERVMQYRKVSVFVCVLAYLLHNSKQHLGEAVNTTHTHTHTHPC